MAEPEHPAASTPSGPSGSSGSSDAEGRDGALGATPVVLRFPADGEHLRLARLATADAAARAGFDYESIDDVRIAVSELCTLFAGPGESITLEFEPIPGALTVNGETRIAELPALGELGGRILGAVVDEHSIEVHDGVARFTFVKRAPHA